MNTKTNYEHAALRLESAVSTNRNGVRWVGLVLGGLPALFLLMDAGMKLFKVPAAVSATVQLGYPESAIVIIGLILLVSTLLYLLPRTAILGGLLLTGYLGGAVASKVRIQAGWFDLIFPILLGGLLWSGLWLRDPRVRELLPTRKR